MRLTLPYPPSVNHYWMASGNRRYISQAGKDFRMAVICAASKAGIWQPDMRRLRVDVQLTMPDRRERDVDNTLKAILDALQHARVYHKDSQIDELTVRRGAVKPPGACVVEIMGVGESGWRQAMGDE